MRTGPGAWIVMSCVCAGVLLSACTRPEFRVTFGGYYFRADAKPVDKKKTLADFNVTVRDATRSVEHAREAGGYEGVRYCIKNFGTSRINWVVGPATPPENLRIEDGRLHFQGTCDPQ